MSLERWVLDTNVLISASLVGASVPARLLHRVLASSGQASARLVFSTATFDELETRLWRPKFDRYVSIEDRKLLLHDLAAVADWVEPGPTVTVGAFSRDKDDDKFVQSALAAGARWLVSGAKDLLSLESVAATRVVTPAEALRLMEAGG